MRHVNRVALVAATLLHFAPAALAQQPPAVPAKRAVVMDPYYAARQAAKEGAAGQSQPTTASNEAVVAASTAAAMPATAAVTPAKPIVYDPYYATRHPVRRDPASATYPTQLAAHEYNEAADTPSQAAESFGYSEPYADDWSAAPAASMHTSRLWNEIQSDRCLWANVEYLSFWMKGNGLPPLVTTSPTGTPQADAGVLGEPNTRILFGGDRAVDGQRNGGRITVGGWWIGDVLGIEGNYWALGRETTSFRAVSDFSNGVASTDPILARPFTNAALADLPDSLIVAFPAFNPPVGLPQNVSGRINASETSEVQSAGLGLRHLLSIDLVRDHRLFVVGGYRFFRLDEDLGIASTLQPMAADVLPGAFINTSDLFATTNQFHGGDVGLMSDLRRGIWILQTQARVAMGNMRETVIIDGQTTVFDGVNTAYAQRGLLAQPNIIGFHHHDQFVVIPELDMKLGLQLTPCLRATAGYNFTYVSRVVRPGNEVDLVIDPVTHTRPAAPVRPTDLWIQGITAGLEFRF
jgi:Putative beta barrel porin-7 (BBP7)